MGDPPSYDQDLLSRLNKLKKTSISLDQPNSSLSTSPRASATPESALSDRLRSLRNAQAKLSPASGSSPSAVLTYKASETPLLPSVPTLIAESRDPLREPFEVDDKTLDELLADLGPDDQWKLDPDDPKDVQKLLDEAKKATATSVNNKVVEPEEGVDGRERSEGRRNEWDEKALSKDIDFSVFRNSDDEDEQGDQGQEVKGTEKASDSKVKEEDEDLEADEIVRKMLDEISLEKPTTPPPASAPSPTTQQPKQPTTSSGDPFSFPSAPSNLPTPSIPSETEQPSKKSLDFDSDISARMAALKGLKTNNLGLPSAPTFKPSDKSVKGVVKKPQYTDEEINTWCIMCMEDATVKCIGCEGDLYCANCWKEGHMGADAGYEEKTHKWAKYKKPR